MQKAELTSKEKRLRTRIKKLVAEHHDLVLEAILREPFWPRDLDPDAVYVRFSDDHSGTIRIIFSRDSDAWIEVVSHVDPETFSEVHRFRTYFGGGESILTRGALVMLAKAIAMDNATRPQRRSVSS